MADVKLFAPKLLKEEGGFVNDPIDQGGATNMGITLNSWKENGYDINGDGIIDIEDLKLLTEKDFEYFLKKQYWDAYWKADYINNQSIAEILVDWCYNSGIWGVKIPQGILGLKEDGEVGPITLAAVNSNKIIHVNPNTIIYEQEVFFQNIWNARKKFYQNIVDKSVKEYLVIHPQATNYDLLKFTQKKFLNGWIIRLNGFTFIK